MMVSFIDSLRGVLRELYGTGDTSQMALLAKAFNNDRGLYRSRNRRPRTDIMVKGLTGAKFVDRGLVAEAAVRAIGAPLGPDQELAFERYIDIAIYTGKWWEGARFTDLAVEVENSWGEAKGTIKDLLLFQAKRKWALFYHGDLEKCASDLSDAIAVAWRAFADVGLLESPETKYEILVLPEKITSRGLLGADVLEAAFLSRDMEGGVRPAQMRL